MTFCRLAGRRRRIEAGRPICAPYGEGLSDPLVRALPVEARTMSCGVYSILLTNGTGSADGAGREVTMSTAAWQRVRRWWSMVVRLGVVMAEEKILSKPQTEMSPGTRMPCAVSCARMPSAVMSLTPMSAVARLCRRISSAVRARPTLYS